MCKSLGLYQHYNNWCLAKLEFVCWLFAVHCYYLFEFLLLESVKQTWQKHLYWVYFIHEIFQMHNAQIVQFLVHI